MDLEEYKNKALQRINPLVEASYEENKNYTCLGIIEETGEITAEIRKPLFKGNFHERPLNIEKIKDELGDLMWYIAFACKKNNINMNELNIMILLEDSQKYTSRRERIIQLCIKMGQASGKIVEQYQLAYKNPIKCNDLKYELSKQYQNILLLCGELGISIDDVLEHNIEKVNSRYDENGKAVTNNLENRWKIVTSQP